MQFEKNKMMLLQYLYINRGVSIISLIFIYDFVPLGLYFILSQQNVKSLPSQPKVFHMISYNLFAVNNSILLKEVTMSL